jgi:hypothetical protein
VLIIRKRVICNDCLTEEIQIAVDDNPTRKKAVHKVVTMNRLKTFMQNMTSLSSRKLLSGFQDEEDTTFETKSRQIETRKCGFFFAHKHILLDAKFTRLICFGRSRQNVERDIEKFDSALYFRCRLCI